MYIYTHIYICIERERETPQLGATKLGVTDGPFWRRFSPAPSHPLDASFPPGTPVPDWRPVLPLTTLSPMTPLSQLTSLSTTMLPSQLCPCIPLVPAHTLLRGRERRAWGRWWAYINIYIYIYIYLVRKKTLRGFCGSFIYNRSWEFYFVFGHSFFFRRRCIVFFCFFPSGLYSLFWVFFSGCA